MRSWRHVLQGVVAFGELFLQGKGYYGDASKAKNEVIHFDGWREKWTTLTDDFFDTLGTEEYVLVIFKKCLTQLIGYEFLSAKVTFYTIYFHLMDHFD